MAQISVLFVDPGTVVTSAHLALVAPTVPAETDSEITFFLLGEDFIELAEPDP
jgi:hypothetical protein